MARWTGFAGRGAIMIVCLVLVPLAALFGTSLPESVRAMLAGPAPRRIDSGPSEPGRAAGVESANHQRNLPMTGTPPHSSQPAVGLQSANHVNAANDMGVRHATAEIAIAGTRPHASEPSSVPPAVPPAAPFIPEDRLHGLLLRLQDLGAEHYRLERAPSASAPFHCICIIPGIRQPFEAADIDPVRSVERVVRQIETWRSQLR